MLAGLCMRVQAELRRDPTPLLEAALYPALTPEITVAVYRCVAEGITNAVRHGNPSRVTVDVGAGVAGRIEVDVCDDGTGGTVVTGVGLTPLRRRAEQLGGRLHVEPVHPTGVRLNRDRR